MDIQRVRQKHNITLHPGWVRPHPHYPRYPVREERERIKREKVEEEPILCERMIQEGRGKRIMRERKRIKGLLGS